MSQLMPTHAGGWRSTLTGSSCGRSSNGSYSNWPAGLMLHTCVIHHLIMHLTNFITTWCRSLYLSPLSLSLWGEVKKDQLRIVCTLRLIIVLGIRIMLAEYASCAPAAASRWNFRSCISLPHLPSLSASLSPPLCIAAELRQLPDLIEKEIWLICMP